MQKIDSRGNAFRGPTSVVRTLTNDVVMAVVCTKPFKKARGVWMR